MSSILVGIFTTSILFILIRLLLRYQSLRTIGGTATVAAVILGLKLSIPDIISQWPEWIDHLLLAVLLIGWGYTFLIIIEYLLVEHWMNQRNMAVSRLARDLVRVLAILLAIGFTMQVIFNVSLNSILISSTLLSAVIGLALQDVLKNIFAGISIQIEHPFEVGQWIQLSDGMGKVSEINWRSTRITNIDGQSLIYPNSVVAAARIINYSQPTNIQAMHTQIAVFASYPPNYVRQILTEAISASQYVCKEPAPVVRIFSYNEYSITYDLKFWLNSYDNYPEKRDTVMFNAWYALQRANIKLPVPIREVYHHANSARLQLEQHHVQIAQIANDLRVAPVLTMLSDNEILQLAERVTLQIFGIGDILVSQGEQGDTLFILRSGRVRVDMRDEDGHLITLNRLGEGACFGEMALMTGVARGATVVAEQDTEVLIVSKEAIAPLMYANPSLPERLGAILVERQQMNQNTIIHQRAAGAADPLIEERRSLVERIKAFFDIGRNEEHS